MVLSAWGLVGRRLPFPHGRELKRCEAELRAKLRARRGLCVEGCAALRGKVPLYAGGAEEQQGHGSTSRHRAAQRWSAGRRVVQDGVGSPSRTPCPACTHYSCALFRIFRMFSGRISPTPQAEAERRLVMAALEDPRNQRLLLLSESCAPLYPPQASAIL